MNLNGKFTTHFARILSFYLVSFFIVEPVFAQTPVNRQTLSTTTDTQRVQDNVPSLREQLKGQNELNKSIIKNRGESGDLLGLGMGQIPTIRVHVLGEVLNPGVYTVSVTDRLTDVLDQAVPKRESQRNVEIRHAGEGGRVYDLYRYYYQGNVENNPFLQDNDVVFVPTQKGAIRIEGPVGRPGTYELSGEKTLLSAVTLAGGFTAAVSKRQKIKIIRVNEFGQKFTFEVDAEKSELKDFKIAKGDVIIIPDLLNNTKKFDYSIETIPGENVFYPTARPDVFVVGAVLTPGAYPYKSHLTVKDYVGYAGATDQSRLTKVVVIRNDKRRNVSMNTSLQPGDLLIVKTRQMNNVTTIVGFASALIGLTLSTLLLRDQLK